MTVTTTTNKSGPYAGDGSATVFNRTFPVVDVAHIEVFEVDDASGAITEITTGIDKGTAGATGTVTFTVAPAAGKSIILSRNVPLTQLTDYSAQGVVAPPTVEQDLDLLEMQVQDAAELLGRSYAAPITGKLFVEGHVPEFDANGNLVDSGVSGSAVAAAAAAAAQSAAQAQAAALRQMATPFDYGFIGGGASNDNQSLIDAFEANEGSIRLPKADYQLGEPGVNGLKIALQSSLDIWADAGAKFTSVDDLDDNTLRFQRHQATFDPNVVVGIRAFNICGDVSAQKTSTSTPFDTLFPRPDEGISAVGVFFRIDGEVDYLGNPYPGFDYADVRGMRCYHGAHPLVAGGDESLFIGGTKDISVDGFYSEGAPDLGIYLSDLTVAGQDSPISKVAVRNCLYRRCMFGVSWKRGMRNVFISDQVGKDTASVVISGDAVEGSETCTIENIYSEGAWRTVRMQSHNRAKISNVVAREHGFLDENGLVPASTFQNGNSAISLEGSTNCEIYGVELGEMRSEYGSVSDASLAAVRLDDDGSGVLTDGTTVRGPVIGSSVSGDAVIEISGSASNTTVYDATGSVVLPHRGSSEPGKTLKRFLDATATLTGLGGTQAIDTTTIKTGWTVDGSRMELEVAGELIGTAGDKEVGFQIGGAGGLTFDLIPAATVGQFVVAVKFYRKSETALRYYGSLMIEGQQFATAHGPYTVDFSANSDLIFRGRIYNTADTIQVDELAFSTYV